MKKPNFKPNPQLIGNTHSPDADQDENVTSPPKKSSHKKEKIRSRKLHQGVKKSVTHDKKESDSKAWKYFF